MNNNTDDFHNNYIFDREIGTGGFSVVKMCIHKSTGDKFAAKIMATKNLNSESYKKIEKEIEICSSLNHKNIVLLYDFFRNQNHFYLIFELVPDGELFDDIVSRESYTETDASEVMRQICEGLNYCHSKKIIHADLKPENLLISRDDHGKVIKIADFGLAIKNVDDEWKFHGFSGTPGYVSPELLLRKPYGYPIDMWACGVILYILLVGYQPFYHRKNEKLFQMIVDGNYSLKSPDWENTTESAKNLIMNLLITDPLMRLTAEEVLSHSWIKNPEKIGSIYHKQNTLHNLKNFNARRKMKGTVYTALLAANKFKIGCNMHTSKNEDSDVFQNEKQEIVNSTERLLSCIINRNFSAFQKLVDPSLTFYEPGTLGNLYYGLEYHKFQFKTGRPSENNTSVTMLNPEVKMLSKDIGLIAFIRLTQSSENDKLTVTRIEETHVWHKKKGNWMDVHFHQSVSANTQFCSSFVSCDTKSKKI